MNKLNRLKFGIIGCSRIAKRSVIPAILKSEFAELEMIGSRTLEKAKEFSKKKDKSSKRRIRKGKRTRRK